MTTILGCPQCQSTDVKSGGVQYAFYPSPIAPGAIAHRQTGTHANGVKVDPLHTVECKNGHRFERCDMVVPRSEGDDRPARRPIMVIAVEAYMNGAAIVRNDDRKRMATLIAMNDHCGGRSAVAIVRSFLSQAGHWRGPEARAIKSELRSMLRDEQ